MIMAPDVIDLISSSPVRTSTKLQPLTGRLLPSKQLPNKVPTHRSHTPPNQCQNRLPCGGVNQSSRDRNDVNDFDDFDDFDDLDASALELLDHEAKRRRVSQQHDGPTGSRGDSLNIPKFSLLSRDWNNRRNLSEIEPIEFTSSLEQLSPAKENQDVDSNILPRAAPITRAIKITAKADPISLFSSDPFASSPRHGGEMPPRGKRAVSLDLFCSSSPPPMDALRKPVTKANHDKDNNPSRQPARASSLTTTQPEEDRRRSSFSDDELHGETTKYSAVDDFITIDDSESSNDGMDELPAITDIDVSKRRPRSPFRRSQSDLTWSKPRSSYAAPSSKRAKPKKTTAEREAEKLRKQQEREGIKAAKAAEKQRAAALAEVNKLRTDKKVSTPEMIVDLPSSLSSELRIQVQEMLQGLGVQYSDWDCPEHTVIKWRRKVTCKFNDDMGLWEPIPNRIADEEVALLILTAEEFVAMALEDSLDSHVADVKRRHGHLKFVYIVQGMTPWFRKNRNTRNRQFASGVRSAGGANTAASSSSSRAAAEHISEDVIEDALLALQVEHDVLIHHTTVATETARWIVNFTQHVSTIPYKKQRDQATSVAGFCMESGQVRTGDNAQDTYVRMLQEIVRVTAPIAYGIATEFDSVTKLVQGLEAGGPERLDAVRKSTNKDGAVSDRTIGQAVSRRMYKVFTGRDEESTDV